MEKTITMNFNRNTGNVFWTNQNDILITMMIHTWHTKSGNTQQNLQSHGAKKENDGNLIHFGRFILW